MLSKNCLTINIELLDISARATVLMRALFSAMFSLFLCACSANVEQHADAPRRIVSLDYCADQYVLKFADRADIVALSTEAERGYSYMREEAKGVPQVRPRAADVLALKPDLVVRSYGGGPGIENFLERAGISMIQLGYPQNLADVRAEVLRVGTELGQPAKARALAEEVDQRLSALAKAKAKGKSRKTLYMTPAGVVAGEGTLVHELLMAAGLTNFQDRPGWNAIPLERLAYERPELVAAAFYGSEISFVDSWSAARHPIAQAQLRELPVVPLDGAWTSCGGWFLLDAVEAMAKSSREAARQ